MEASTTKLSLDWKNFDQSMRDNLSRLREGSEFSDVTLVTRDEAGPTFPAHKLVLAASSPVLRRILQVDPQHRPLLYLSCVTSLSLRLLLTFIYEGRVEVRQDQLDEFLTVAEELEIEGLTRTENNHSEKIQIPEDKKEEMPEKEVNEEKDIEAAVTKLEAPEKKQDVVIPARKTKEKKLIKKEDQEIEHVAKTYCYEKIPIYNLDEIKPTIEAMTERVGKVWRCKFCGKTTNQAQKNSLSTHIESHFEGLSYKCSHCDKSCKNRGALRGHMHRYHQAVPDPSLEPRVFSAFSKNKF